MRPTKRILTGVACLALMVGAGAGLADAAMKGRGGRAGAPARAGGPGPGGQAIADYLGLTAAELRTQLQSGKTLAQIATVLPCAVATSASVLPAWSCVRSSAAVRPR